MLMRTLTEPETRTVGFVLTRCHSCCIPIYSFRFPVSDCPRTTCTQLCVH